MAGDREGEHVVAFGPLMSVGSHPEQQYTHVSYFMAVRPQSTGRPCRLRLEGPPTCCRLLKLDDNDEEEEGMYIKSSVHWRD